MAEQKKAVLMMHTDQAQGELWQTALATQQLEVIWENISLDLVQYLEKCDRQQLPDLLIMDMAIKSPTSETLQSSSVCQWISKQQAPTKVVLFNPRQEKIKDIEHSWALRRGASDVLPRLSPENLMAEVARVTALIGCSLISQPLEKIAKSIGAKTGATQPRASELAVKSEVDALKPSSKSETKNNSKANQKSNAGEVVMYRGVRIRR
ncbi:MULTISPECIES: response regulator [Pseudanabaena]|jgi:CheY-like chemotaxis protein|uniref:response regulator n=1 Tax=Pseudanabaena TaxID=1152 RepID=UPI002478FFB5|nr:MULTISPECIES: response regulator [Pseudanabaena]MEA5487715.1 response regulator [Pseudanabaena sp. CCNP1317]WGS70816.1 response regulator [Pseudanabaena galeata CCNP1313]